MAWTKAVALSLALGIGSAAWVVPALAVEEAPAKEVKTEPKKEVKGPKLWGPWAKLESLTAEQRIKIDEIHKKTLAEQKKLADQETADITALLTDEQKVELQAMKEADAAAKKAKDAERAAERAKKQAEGEKNTDKKAE
jgi:Spy/CpxP family protein refolding chaperone